MKVVPLLAGSLLLAGVAVGGGEDTAPHAAYPAPRRSGEGRVPFTSSNVQLLGWKTLADFPGANATCNDCWGYTSPSGREYAVLALENGTGFVEITDPGQPVLVEFLGGPTNLWRGIKTYSSYAYAVSEGGGGIQVFDLASIDAGSVTLVNTVLTGGLTTATHTLALNEDSGFLYRAGGGTQGLVIYDLADPADPTLAGEWHTNYVHECQVVNWDGPGPFLGREIAFCFMGSLGELKILDVTNKAAITGIASLTYPGATYTHQGWLSADQQHLYLNDEFDDGTFGASRTRVLDVSDLTAPSLLGFFSSASSSDHNLYVQGNRIYESNFRSGLRILDNTNPSAPVEVAFFDTYPADDLLQLNSLAYNYPFFASGTILGADVEKGMFLWREGAAELSLAFVGGAPDLVDPTGQVLQFDVFEDQPGDLVPGTVTLHFGTGGTFTSVGATDLGNDLYQAALPAQTCGAEIELYLSAQSSDGTTWTDPPAAPTQVHLARAAAGRTVLSEDTLESNSGWIAGAPGDTATMGQWTRVNPVGTSAQPEDDHTAAPGVFCFITGQAAPGDPPGSSDVDGGVTTLRSPVFDATGSDDPHVAYWRWYSNHQNLFEVDDSFVVDISNDAGASWTHLELILPGNPDALGGWIRHEARIADFVAPTSDMRLRFIAQDLGGASTVEAAVDDLQLLHYDCPSVSLVSVDPASGPFDGGNVVTLTGSGFEAGLTTVRFGAHDAQVVHVLSATQLTARVPRASGPVVGRLGWAELRVDVVVSNPGSDTLRNAYSYLLKNR